MTLPSGTRLGPYEVLSPLGAGGMGEVYRARDTRLDREVAVKVLPSELSSDAERLKRFEKEARSASSLNHPNIVTIYDIGAEGGVSYIAMEKVEGPTLRALLVGGALPIKKLFQVAPQIAEGLAKAHEAGIVHRDLKPENVMVTKDGLVKILDFGLAKLTSRTSGSDEGSHLPTMTATTPGVVVGTVGYMSPEQASGLALDFRSDQFALGSILYEMATGKRAFQKKTAIDTLSAILNEEPEPIGAINPQVPAPLRWIVERCLEKEPEGRYVSTRDLARDLATVRDHVSEASLAGIAPAVGARKGIRVRAAVLGLAFAAAVALGVFAQPPSLEGPVRNAPDPPAGHLPPRRHRQSAVRTGRPDDHLLAAERARFDRALRGAARKSGIEISGPAFRRPPVGLSFGRARDPPRRVSGRDSRHGALVRGGAPRASGARRERNLGSGWKDPCSPRRPGPNRVSARKSPVSAPERRECHRSGFPDPVLSARRSDSLLGFQRICSGGHWRRGHDSRPVRKDESHREDQLRGRLVAKRRRDLGQRDRGRHDLDLRRDALREAPFRRLLPGRLCSIRRLPRREGVAHKGVG